MLTRLSPEGLRVVNEDINDPLIVSIDGSVMTHSKLLWHHLGAVFNECGFASGGFPTGPEGHFYLTHRRVQDFNLKFSFSYSKDTQTLTLTAKNTLPFDSPIFTRLLPLDSLRNVLGEVLELVRQCWAERA